MKFIHKLLFSSVLLFFGISCAFAKEVLFSCEYYKPYDSLAGTQELAILCDIYDNYSHQCYMEANNSTASTASNKESILNWTSATILKWKARDYVKENNVCPNYMVVRDDKKVNGYKIYAAPDYESAEELRTKLGASSYHIAQLKGSATGNQVSLAERYMNDAIDNIQNTMDDYSLDSCMDEDAIITRISKCKSIIDAFRTRIYSYKTERDNYVRAGTLSEDHELILTFDSLYEDAQIFLDDAQTELDDEQDKIDEEMNNAASGSGSDSSNNNGDSRPTDTDINLSGLCNETRVARTLKFLGILITLVKIFVPLLIIVLGSIDFGKAMIDGKGDDIPKKVPVLVKRFITGVIIFLVPSVIDFLFGVIDTYSDTMAQYENCWTCLLDPDECNVND